MTDSTSPGTTPTPPRLAVTFLEKCRQLSTRWNERMTAGVQELRSKCTVENVRSLRPLSLLSDPWPTLLLWTVCGVLALVVPRNKWHEGMEEYYAQYGYAIEYQNAQDAYEQAQRNQDDNNNNNNNNYYNNGSSSTRSSSPCYWFQYNCRRRRYEQLQYYYQMYGNNNNNNNRDAQGGNNLPFWYRFIGGVTEEERRSREEMQRQNYGADNEQMNRASSQLRLVYAWSVLLFFLLLLHGMYILARSRPTGHLRLALFLYAQFAVVTIVLLGQGILQTDERQYETSVYGWYGQLGVLMVYTNYWLTLYCAVFIVVLTVRDILLYFWNKRCSTSNKCNSNNALNSTTPTNNFHVSSKDIVVGGKQRSGGFHSTYIQSATGDVASEYRIHTDSALYRPPMTKTTAGNTIGYMS